MGEDARGHVEEYKANSSRRGRVPQIPAIGLLIKCGELVLSATRPSLESRHMACAAAQAPAHSTYYE
jgi:hypothetical protein